MTSVRAPSSFVVTALTAKCRHDKNQELFELGPIAHCSAAAAGSPEEQMSPQTPDANWERGDATPPDTYLGLLQFAQVQGGP
jgi:hypothetical protein